MCEYSMYNISSIVAAVVDVDCNEDMMIHHGIKFLRAICNVRKLQISGSTIKTLFSSHALTHLPAFPSLVDLTVALDSNGFDANHLIYLLYKMPNMESLTFDDYSSEYHEYDVPLGIISQCILSCLKFIQLCSFDGSESELRLVQYFLKNARFLEKMTIMPSGEFLADLENQVEITKQLFMIPRGSTCSVVEFSVLLNHSQDNVLFDLVCTFRYHLRCYHMISNTWEVNTYHLLAE